MKAKTNFGTLRYQTPLGVSKLLSCTFVFHTFLTQLGELGKCYRPKLGKTKGPMSVLKLRCSWKVTSF